MTTLADDWLAAGDRIVARLADQVRPLRMVETMSTLAAEAIEQRVNTQVPAAIVVYMGDRITPDPRVPTITAGAQRWCVVLAVRNARAGGSNAALAGEALSLIHMTLPTT